MLGNIKSGWCMEWYKFLKTQQNRWIADKNKFLFSQKIYLDIYKLKIDFINFTNFKKKRI